MASTTQMHKTKFEALVNTISNVKNEMKQASNEIGVQIEINNAAIVQHEKEIEQLRKDNEELVTLKANNEAFISKVEKILEK